MSDIIKSNFISFSEHKREIKTVDKNDPNVLKSTLNNSRNNQGSNRDPSHESLSLADLGLDTDRLGIDLKSGMKTINNGQGSLNIKNEQYKVNANNKQNNKKPLEENVEDQIFHQPQDESISLTEEHSYIIETLKEEGRNQGYEEGFLSGKNDGYDTGYEEGKIQAEHDVNLALEAYSREQDGVMQELKDQLIQEYSDYKKELEPKMLSIIEDLVIKIIGVQKTSKGTIMHLIKCGLDELELHGDLVIRVSSKDLDYVIERKHELTEELSEKVIVEILKDQQLEENECVIETEMGTIDCSLGTQLEGLLKELRLIKDSLLVE